MDGFLKGNYRLPKGARRKKGLEKPTGTLTQSLEESALAKLGGSICFVIKGNTFVWQGDEDEKAGS